MSAWLRSFFRPTEKPIRWARFASRVLYCSCATPEIPSPLLLCHPSTSSNSIASTPISRASLRRVSISSSRNARVVWVSPVLGLTPVRVGPDVQPVLVGEVAERVAEQAPVAALVEGLHLGEVGPPGLGRAGVDVADHPRAADMDRLDRRVVQHRVVLRRVTLPVLQDVDVEHGRGDGPPVANDVPVTPMLTNPVFACRQPPLGFGEPWSWYCQRAFTAGFQQLPTELLQATCAGSVTVVPARGPACAPSGSITRTRANPRPIVASVRRTDPRSSPGEPRIAFIKTRGTSTAQPSIRALGPCVLACRGAVSAPAVALPDPRLPPEGRRARRAAPARKAVAPSRGVGGSAGQHAASSIALDPRAGRGHPTIDMGGPVARPAVGTEIQRVRRRGD